MSLKLEAKNSVVHPTVDSAALLHNSFESRSHQFEMENPAERSYRNLLITSFVLAMVGLFFFAGGFANWGAATLPNVMRSGFGVLHQFIGTHCVMLGIAHMASSLVFFAVAHYRAPKSAS